MRINDKTIYEFGGEILDKKITPSTFRKEVDFRNKLREPILLSKSFEDGIIELTLIIKGDTEEEARIQYSNLIKEISDCNINFIGNNIYYRAVLDKNVTRECFEDELEDKFTIQLYLVLVTLYTFKAQVIELLNKITSKTINVEGNKETPVIVEVTPSIDLIDLTINGLDEDPIVLKNLKANKKIIINGEDGTVLQEGVNKYGDIEMWSFPSLKPGVNTITVSKNSVDINIRYKPRFI